MPEGITASELGIKPQDLTSVLEPTQSIELPQPRSSVLSQRLNQYVDEHPGEFQSENVSNVWRFVDQIRLKEDRKILKLEWNKYFKEKDDFRLYFKINSEWHGITTAAVQKKLGGEALSFYEKLRKFGNNYKNPDTHELDPEAGQKFFEEFFPKQQKDWSHLKTDDDFREEYARHVEWHNLGTEKIAKIKGGDSFYRLLRRHRNNYINPKTGELDTLAGQKFFEEFFPSLHKDSSFLVTEDGFREYWKTHPEIHGLNTADVQKLGKDSFTFLQKLRKFGNNYKNPDTHELDPEAGQKFFEEFFPKQQKDWSHLKTDDDFREIWKSMPDWHGLSTSEMRAVKGNISAGVFLHKLRSYCNNYINPKTGELDTLAGQKFFEEFFKPKGSRRQYEFSNGKKITFDSRPERIVGILLNMHGMLEDPTENKNVHVRVNKVEKNSFDFLVNNVFIEFHPLHYKEADEGYDLVTTMDDRLNHITREEYSSKSVYHIWELKQLYDIITDPLINPKVEKGEIITEDQFRHDVQEAYLLAGKYDIEHESQQDLQSERRKLQKAA